MKLHNFPKLLDSKFTRTNSNVRKILDIWLESTRFFTYSYLTRIMFKENNQYSNRLDLAKFRLDPPLKISQWFFLICTLLTIFFMEGVYHLSVRLKSSLRASSFLAFKVLVASVRLKVGSELARPKVNSLSLAWLNKGLEAFLDFGRAGGGGGEGALTGIEGSSISYEPKILRVFTSFAFVHFFVLGNFGFGDLSW